MLSQMILITGASGFLGNEITAFLSSNKLSFISLGRSADNSIQCDLSNQVPALPLADMVVHAAGKAHVVPKTAEAKADFFKVNVQGTKNLLNALENNVSLKKFVFISTVAVYGLTQGTDINEDTLLLAIDPYGRSKIEAEKLIENWCAKKNIDWYIFRLPLIAGKNAPGNLGAMVKGIKTGRYYSIGKAQSKKSMVLASDIANLLLKTQGPSGIYNLTDGYHPSFGELEKKIADFYQKKPPHSLLLPVVKILGLAGDLISKFPINSNKLKKITSTLTFDDSKARAQLNWRPQEILKAWKIE